MVELEFIYREHYQYLTACMLNVTDSCNLQCRYCFVEQHPHFMDYSVAQKTADWLHENLEKKKALGIKSKRTKCLLYFFGGEPMLCYNSIIVPIVNYCNKKYPNDFDFGMTTNGTLLNDKVIKWLREHEFSLLLSIDGNKETQDFNRPCRNTSKSSFDLLSKNIPTLLKYYPNLKFRSTIYEPTVQNLFDNYLFAESLGFKSWEGIEDHYHPWSQESLKILKEQMNKIYAYRLQQLMNHQKPMSVHSINKWIYWVINLYNNSNGYNVNNWLHVDRCGLGTGCGSVGYDGNIYGCQEQDSKEEKNIFWIGNIFDGGIDIEKHTKLLKFYFDNQKIEKQKKEECSNCELNQMCKVNVMGCPSAMYTLFNDMNSMPEVQCVMKKTHYYNTLFNLKILFELEDEWITEYLLKLISNNGEDENEDAKHF